MTIFDILLLLLLALLCGAVGQAMSGFSHASLIVTTTAAFLGALPGFWLARGLHLPELFSVSIGSAPFPMLWSLLGAMTSAMVVSFVSHELRSMD